MWDHFSNPTLLQGPGKSTWCVVHCFESLFFKNYVFYFFESQTKRIFHSLVHYPRQIPPTHQPVSNILLRGHRTSQSSFVACTCQRLRHQRLSYPWLACLAKAKPASPRCSYVNGTPFGLHFPYSLSLFRIPTRLYITFTVCEYVFSIRLCQGNKNNW